MSINSRRGASFQSSSLLLVLLLAIVSMEARAQQWSGPDGNGNISNANTGNVGIGTTSPSQTLHVQRDQNAATMVLVKNAAAGSASQADVRIVNDAGVLGQFGIYSSATAVYGAASPNDVHLYSSSNLAIMSDSATGSIKFATGGSSEKVRIDSAGKVGIGKPNPSEALDVIGNIKASGTIFAKYQDVAEWVPSSEQLAAGTVVVLDPNKSNQVLASTAAYDTRVAGVISAQPGITLGEKSDGKVLVATTGRVRVKVDAARGPIAIGDLLVTSDVPGVAMKSEAVNIGGVSIHRPGTIIGKALEPLAKGQGEILVLLSLQ